MHHKLSRVPRFPFRYHFSSPTIAQLHPLDPLMTVDAFPFIFQPSDKPTRTHSAELLRFNERASLRSGIHIDRRFHRAIFVTVDLCILLTISICPYPPCIFIEQVYHKPSISISLLYTVGSCDNFIAYVPFIILSHHYIWPKFSSNHYFSLPWSLRPSSR